MDDYTKYNPLLLKLTQREREVLALRCESLTMKEIAKFLGVKIGTVEFHLGNIYDKLELTDERMYNQRKWIILTYICPSLRELQRSQSKESLGESPEESPIVIIARKRGKLAPSHKALAIVRDERKIEEKTKNHQRSHQFPGNQQPPQLPVITYLPKPRFWRRAIPWFLVFLLAAALAGMWFFRIRSKQPTGISALATTQIPLEPSNTYALFPTSTQTVFSTATVANSITPTPTPSTTSTPTLTPTSISSPTNTQTPTITPTHTATSTNTNTPTPSPTPIPSVFWDTFDAGIKPEWNVINGLPGIVNEEFTAQTDTVWLSLSLPAGLKNYKVEFDVSSLPNCGSPGMIIALVFSDVRNYMGFFSSGCENWWSIYTNGKGRIERLPLVYKDGLTHYQFVIQDNYVTLFIDTVEAGSVYNNVIPVGKIGLFMSVDVMIDNFAVYALP